MVQGTVTMHFDAVIFDCDGVLVDSEMISMEVSQRIVADLGWEADLATMFEMFVGSSHEYFVSTIETQIGRPLAADWNRPYRGWLEAELRDKLLPIPGVVDAIDRISLPTAVASNSGHDRIRLSLDLVGLLPHFDGRISSAEDVDSGKPEPDVYLHAAEILGVPPHRCIAIDDSRFGIVAAQRAGMRVLAFDGDQEGRGLPLDGPRTSLLTDMDDLPALVDRLVTTGRSESSRRAKRRVSVGDFSSTDAGLEYLEQKNALVDRG